MKTYEDKVAIRAIDRMSAAKTKLDRERMWAGGFYALSFTSFFQGIVWALIKLGWVNTPTASWWAVTALFAWVPLNAYWGYSSLKRAKAELKAAEEASTKAFMASVAARQALREEEQGAAESMVLEESDEIDDFRIVSEEDVTPENHERLGQLMQEPSVLEKADKPDYDPGSSG